MCDLKTCLAVLKTQFNEFFDSKEVNASDFNNKSLQKGFEDHTGTNPQTYRVRLLQYLDELDMLFDERVIQYWEMLMKERENFKNDADAEKILVEKVASGIEHADIGPSYDSDTVSEVHHGTFENVFAHSIQNHVQPESIPDTYMVNENNSNIISDIPNMDPVRDKEEHDYVDDEQQHAFFDSLVNNLKCEVENCTKSHELNINQRVRNLLSEEFEPLVRDVNFQLNCFEKSLVNEMKDYVISLEDEFNEKCLILDIQNEFFKTQFELVISKSYSNVYENKIFE
ncbi:hypothetical protein Tco_1337211 [Tanacetum coccineum]